MFRYRTLGRELTFAPEHASLSMVFKWVIYSLLLWQCLNVSAETIPRIQNRFYYKSECSLMAFSKSIFIQDFPPNINGFRSMPDYSSFIIDIFIRHENFDKEGITHIN